MKIPFLRRQSSLMVQCSLLIIHCALLAALSPTLSAQKRPMEVEDLFRIKRVSDPQLSPDGRWVAFVITGVDKSTNKSNSDIWVLPSAGGEPRRLTDSPKHDRHPRWSPDGRSIAFESNRDGKFQLYVMNADGSGVTRITDAGENRRPYWCPSCYERIVFVSNRDGGAWSTYATNADGSNQVRLTVQLPGSTAPDDDPAWTGLPVQSAFPSRQPTPVPTPRP